MPTMKNKALFLDRDGVINVDKEYVHKIEDFEFCKGIFELCEFFLKKGFLIFIVTNQSGIARGFYTEEDFKILSAFVLNALQKKISQFQGFITVRTWGVVSAGNQSPECSYKLKMSLI